MKSYPNLEMRGNTWHYSFKINGKRYRGSCATHRVAEAQAILRQKMAEAEAGVTPVTERARETRGMTIDFLANWDLERSRLAARNEQADQTIRSIWKRISTYFESVTEVSDDSLASYAGHMLRQGYSTSTIKRDLWAIRRAYAWAAKASNLPALGDGPDMAASPKGKAAGRLIDNEDLEAWLVHLTGRALAHAVIGVSTGIRKRELERATQAWLARDGSALNLPADKTKGRKERTVPLTPSASALVKAFVPLLVDSRAAWRTACRKAGIEEIAMRDLRHTFASRLSRFDSDGVRLVCGWSKGDKNAAMFYQHLDEDRLKNIVEAVPKVFPFLAAHAKRALDTP